MSQAILASAVRDHLQSVFGLGADSCEVGFDGRPKPGAGELYLAIHEGAWLDKSGDYDLHEEYQIAITVTMRMGFAPKDRWGIAVWTAPDGLDVQMRKVITAIHHNLLLRVAASDGLNGGRYFATPLFLLRPPDKPQPQGPDWFSAPIPESDTQIAECGVSQTAVFGKCQLCQAIDEME